MRLAALLVVLALAGCGKELAYAPERHLWVTEVPDDLPGGFWVSDTGSGRIWPWNGAVGRLCVGYTDDPPPIYSIHYWTYEGGYPSMGERIDLEPLSVPESIADCIWPYDLH